MDNSITNMKPHLVKEWSERNLPLSPDKVPYGSNKLYWWKGSCGHEWEASAKARSAGERCPICSGARVVAGINDLKTICPSLAEEWSTKNKIKPTQVSVGSHKKVLSYFEVSANNRLDLADKIKRIFREKNIYILSNSQDDIEQCKKAFLRWKEKTQ